MNLSSIALITALAIGIPRLHALTLQFQLLASENLSQNDRILGMSNAVLLLPLPIMLLLVWSTKAKLRVSEFDRVLAVASALVLALFSMLPGIFQLLARLPQSMPAGFVGWSVAGLFGQFMAMVFLLVLASQREDAQAAGMQASMTSPAPMISPASLISPYESSSVRTSAAIAAWAGAIVIVVYIAITVMMLTDSFGPTRGSHLEASPEFLSTRFFGFVSMVISFVMALVVYRSDPSRRTHYETSVAGGRG
jgi:hypothetical protein